MEQTNKKPKRTPGDTDGYQQQYKNYKEDAIQAAKDFGYGDVVIEKLNNAKSDYEIANIMSAARKEKWGL